MRAVGFSHALSVGNTSHAAVTVGAEAAGMATKAAFFNSGTTVIAVRVSNATAGTATFPTDGTPTTSTEFVLPASMTRPVVWDVPTMPFSMTAIGSAAGPSIIYVTPVTE